MPVLQQTPTLIKSRPAMTNYHPSTQPPKASHAPGRLAPPPNRYPQTRKNAILLTKKNRPPRRPSKIPPQRPQTWKIADLLTKRNRLTRRPSKIRRVFTTLTCEYIKIGIWQ